MTTLAAYLSTNLLILDGLKNASTNAFINDATVVITSIVDVSDVVVVGPTFPLTMEYIAASDGRYEVVIPHTTEFVENGQYIAEITVTHDGSQAKRYFRFRVKKLVTG